MDTRNLRTWSEIDLDALLHNFENVKKQMGKASCCAVIKANAYGHGAVRVARLLEKKADYFAVATAEEAHELRLNSIETPILILGIVPEGQLPRLISENVTLALAGWEQGKQIENAARKQNMKAKVHIAVDTGMGRIGFLPNEDSIKEITELFSSDALEMEGIFSHFATADEEHLSFAREQTEIFERFLSKLKEQGVTFPLTHLYNSSGICRLEERYDMVRQGITLYGVAPSKYVNPSEIQPVMAFKSRISHLKTMEKGMPISYGSTYITEKKMRVATVPMGYGDGVPRALSNRGCLFILGKRAPILGRVCMDQLMVDVTDIEEAKVGSEAELFGKNISVSEQAELSGTIPYELLCNVNIRVPRVYLKEQSIEGVDCALPL